MFPQIPSYLSSARQPDHAAIQVLPDMSTLGSQPHELNIKEDALVITVIYYFHAVPSKVSMRKFQLGLKVEGLRPT